MIKAILFDFWGTLVEQGVWSPVKQVQNILDIRVQFSEYVVRMERAMMTSKFEQLKDAFEAVAKEFGATCPPHKMEQLVGMWNKSWMLAKPYDDVADTLQHLRGEYKLILVSNTDCFGVQRVLDKFGLSHYFDKIYLSCEAGLLKTDKNFMLNVMDENGLTPDDCAMVGDSLQSDVESAQRLGIKAILIDRKDMRDFKPKIISLAELPGALHD